jgi:hypothetical protein
MSGLEVAGDVYLSPRPTEGCRGDDGDDDDGDKQTG